MAATLGALVAALLTAAMAEQALDVKVGFMFAEFGGEGDGAERAFLLDKIGFSTSAGAVPIALDRIRDEQLLPGVNLSVVWRFSQCDESVAAGRSIELFENQAVDVIIGPPCSIPSEIVGVFSNYFNIPQFSWAATSLELADHHRYPTVTRVVGSAIRLGRAMMELLHYFDWTRVALFYTDDLASRKCMSVAAGAYKHFPSNDIHIVHVVEIPRETPNDDEIDLFLDVFPELTRVVILCIDLDADVRRFMLRANERGLAGEEFVYLVPDYVRFENQTDIWVDRTKGTLTTGRNNESFRSMQNMLFFEMLLGANAELFSFKKRVIKRIAEWPFYYDTAKLDENYGSIFAPFLHDSVYLYAIALNKTLAEGGNKTDGRWITANAKNVQFQGMSGHVVIDDVAGREPTFVLKGFRSDGKLWQLLKAEMHSTSKMIVPLVPQYAMWETRGGYAPKWYPRCGWTGELCDANVQSFLPFILIGSAVVALISVALIVGCVVYYRRKILAEEMALMLWKIEPRNLERLVNMQHDGSLSTITTDVSDDIAAIALRGDDRVAHYRGTLVWLKVHHASLVLSSKTDHMQMKMLRDMQHDNLNRFVGLCLEGTMLSVWGYCGKGSLQDILLCPGYKLDWFFKYALIRDLANGMEYLHDSSIKSHGHLKSTNCLVNARWVLMITDYGLPGLRSNSDIAVEQRLWTSPELLKMENPPPGGTPAGDVYSLGIILQEILTRDTPFGSFKKAPQEIVNLVRAGLDPPFRPDVANQNDADMDPGMVTLMRDCWAESATSRPDLKHVKVAIKQMNRGRETNLLDHAMKMVEKYATGLEQTVTDRTKLLSDETGKADELLFKFLPKRIATRLKLGQTVPPEWMDSVSIIFTDIAHFDKISSMSTPLQLVNLLNDVYYQMDEIIDGYAAFKVSCVNDTYMIACGLETAGHSDDGVSTSSRAPPSNAAASKQHVATAAELGLHLQLRMSGYYMAHLPKEKCSLRVGMHVGPCVAGVIGNTMPRYYMFGETVSTAQTMLEYAKAQTVHISENTNGYLTEILGGYITKPRGEVQLRGKDTIFTYWLLGKKTKGIEDKTQSTTSGDTASRGSK